MKKFITSMVAIVIGVIAFALPVSTPEAPSSTTTRIPLRYNRESASKQKRMPSYGYDEQILCWYDGNNICVDFTDCDITCLVNCTLNIISVDMAKEYVVSPAELTQGIAIGKLEAFEVEIIVPSMGVFQGYY